MHVVPITCAVLSIHFIKASNETHWQKQIWEDLYKACLNYSLKRSLEGRWQRLAAMQTCIVSMQKCFESKILKQWTHVVQCQFRNRLQQFG